MIHPSKRPRARSAFITLLLALWVMPLPAQLVRVPNNTLQFPAEPVLADGDIVLTDFLPGLSFESPVCIRSLPGNTNALVVVERHGRVILIPDLDNPEPQVFLDIRDRVFASDWITSRRTEGLTSVAFHPRFPENGRLFVSYCHMTNAPDGSERHYNRLSEFQASDDGTRGLPESEIIYIHQFDEGDGHNINDLHFGPDRYLYVAIGDEGDGGTGGDEYNNAQRIDKDFFSAIMRIDVDKRAGNRHPNPHPAGSTNYWVPADNPYVGATSFLGQPVDTNRVRTEFWAVGLRNPWRISFDPLTGFMYEGDVGQHWREEINRISRGGNYGWSFKEGLDKGPKSPAPAGHVFTDPLFQYGTGWGQFDGYSVTGGVVYRGFGIPSLYGHLIFADYMSGNLWAMNVDATPVPRPRWLLNHKGIASFGYDPRNGDILLVSHHEEKPGRIYRLDVAGGSGASYPETLADTGIFSDLETLTPHPGIEPYDVNLPFWSDRAAKFRWFSIPDTDKKMVFSREGHWTYPAGTTWIKHFELEGTPGVPATGRRVETRVLIKSTTGTGLYGLTYKWDDQGVNATLVPEAGETEILKLGTGSGMREQAWIYPSRAQCLACHTTSGGLALAFNTEQLNRERTYGSVTTNQIGALAAAGYLIHPPTNMKGLRALAAPDDETVSRTYRVRSYLAANCAFCHSPGGGALAKWDARTTTPLSFAGILDGELNHSFGSASNRVVIAGAPERSALLLRIASHEGRMPPIGSTLLDEEAIDLLTAWIAEDLPDYELYAGWAKRVFSSNSETDTSEHADPDGDGSTNYEEYLAGTDPLSSKSRFNISTRVLDGDFQLSVTQPPNRALLLESTRSLGNPYWESLITPGNTVHFPAAATNRSVIERLNHATKFWRAKLFEP